MKSARYNFDVLILTILLGTVGKCVLYPGLSSASFYHTGIFLLYQCEQCELFSLAIYILKNVQNICSKDG